MHFSIVECETKDANHALNLSSLNELSWRLLLIALLLSCSNFCLALCMICFALLLFIVDLSKNTNWNYILAKASYGKSAMVPVVTILNL